LGLALALIYSGNRRELGTFDTVATSMLPLAILRGDGPALDRYQLALRDRDGLILSVVRSRWRVVSRYPVAPALLVLPLYAVQTAVLDWRRPGWDGNPFMAFDECRWMAKRSICIVMALTAVLLHRVILGLGLRRAALLAVIAAALGSNLWVTASQALWQHGPAALMLIAAFAMLQSEPVGRGRMLLAGVAAAGLFAMRLIDGQFTLVITAYVARSAPRRLVWFLVAPIVVAVALFSYNLLYFGALTGGQAELENRHPQFHGLRSMWSEDPIAGAAGTLLSPSRGLFIFSPWVAVALAIAMIPAVARNIARFPLFCWLLAALVPYLVLLSTYSVWWGGHCFGPRYWTDVIPLFAILLAFGLEWTMAHSRALTALSVLSIAVAIGVQAIGALCYPSTWNQLPANVDLHHERLWNWRDTELSRSLMDGLQNP
jgi:hypothetical protein